MSGTPGLAATPIVKAGGCADRIAADIESVIQPVDDIDEPDGVHIEDRGGVGIVAQLGRVAGEAQDIFQPDGRCAEQIGLNAEHVAVAAGVVQDRLDTGLLLNLNAEALRAHAG